MNILEGNESIHKSFQIAWLANVDSLLAWLANVIWLNVTYSQLASRMRITEFSLNTKIGRKVKATYQRFHTQLH